MIKTETKPVSPKRKDEAGVALTVALLMVLVITAMIGATMFSSSINALTTGGFRTEAETLLVGDAGMQEVIEWFSSADYVPVPVDKLSMLDLTKSPVTIAGTNTPVRLTTFNEAGATSSYPTLPGLLNVVNSFNSKFTGPLVKASGIGAGKYFVDAQLLGVKRVTFFDAGPPGTPGTIERWLVQIQSTKSFNPNNQIAAIIELGTVPAFMPVLGGRSELKVDGCLKTTAIQSLGESIQLGTGNGSYISDKIATVLSNDKMTLAGAADKPVEIQGSAVYIKPNTSGTSPTVSGQVTINNGLNGLPTPVPRPFPFLAHPEFNIAIPPTPPKVNVKGGGPPLNPGDCGNTITTRTFNLIHLNGSGCNLTLGNGSFGSKNNTHLQQGSKLTVGDGDKGFGNNTHIENGSSLSLGAGDASFENNLHIVKGSTMTIGASNITNAGDLQITEGSKLIQNGPGNSAFTNVVVDKGSELAIGPGNSTFFTVDIKGNSKASFDAAGGKIVMKKLVVENSELTLGAGVYDIEEIEIKNGAKVTVSPNTTFNVKKFRMVDDFGPTQLAVKGPGKLYLNAQELFEIDKGAIFNGSTETGKTVRAPGDFVVLVGTPSKQGNVVIRENAIVSALISANNDAKLDKGATLIGSLMANKVDAGGDADCTNVIADKSAIQELVFKTRFHLVSWIKRNFN